MTRVNIIRTLALCCLALPLALRAQQLPPWTFEPYPGTGTVVYTFATHDFSATDGAVIKYGGAVLTADKIEGNDQTGEVLAEGKVRIQRDEQIWVGERIRYNFNTHEIQAEQFRTGKSPAFAEGDGLHVDVTKKITNAVLVATNAYVTTDDVAKPAMMVRAKYIKIIPGDKIIARHATLYVEGVPVFYFPYYTRNLGPRDNNFNFIPGYRSEFGPFVLGSYTWFLNDQIDGILHLDYREKRGVGTGPDINYDYGRWGEGSLKYYYLHDNDPTTNFFTGPIPPPDNRQRVWFSYQGTPATNLEVKSLVRYQSDSSLLHDFFESEYHDNPQPNTYFNVRKFWQNFSLDTYVQPRVNPFYETVERLPDVRLTGFRQQLGDSPIYYDSESTLGYYRRAFAETNGPMPGDFAAARADTFHQLLLPMTFFGWLNVTPRVGGRVTYYSKATGAGAMTDELYRGVFNTGAEFSFKMSRVWPGVRNNLLEVDGLRHIVEPSINYVYVPTPTQPTNALPPFDYVLPSLRLLPITFPEYNAIDSITSADVFRFGLRNKFQTKRDGQLVDVLNWNVYTDWLVQTDPGQATFSDLYSDLIFRPRSWLKVESLVRYGISSNEFNMSSTQITFEPNDRWSWTVGQFYLRDDYAPSQAAPAPTATLQGNNTFTSSFFYRVNENWALRASQVYEARYGHMQEQVYTVYRDLRSWTAALSFRVQDNQNGPQNFTVAFTFSLKAHPKYGVGGDAVKPYGLLGS